MTGSGSRQTVRELAFLAFWLTWWFCGGLGVTFLQNLLFGTSMPHWIGGVAMLVLGAWTIAVIALTRRGWLTLSWKQVAIHWRKADRLERAQQYVAGND